MYIDYVSDTNISNGDVYNGMCAHNSCAVDVRILRFFLRRKKKRIAQILDKQMFEVASMFPKNLHVFRSLQLFVLNDPIVIAIDSCHVSEKKSRKSIISNVNFEFYKYFAWFPHRKLSHILFV